MGALGWFLVVIAVCSIWIFVKMKKKRAGIDEDIEEILSGQSDPEADLKRKYRLGGLLLMSLALIIFLGIFSSIFFQSVEFFFYQIGVILVFWLMFSLPLFLIGRHLIKKSGMGLWKRPLPSRTQLKKNSEENTLLDAQIMIGYPPDIVWSYFTEPRNWEKWWGGVKDAQWCEGGKLEWALGGLSPIKNIIPAKKVQIAGNWMSTTFTFQPEGDEKTLFRIQESLPKGGGAFNDGGVSRLNQLNSSLMKFKSLIGSHEKPDKITEQTGMKFSEKLSKITVNMKVSELKRMLGKPDFVMNSSEAFEMFGSIPDWAKGKQNWIYKTKYGDVQFIVQDKKFIAEIQTNLEETIKKAVSCND